MRPLTQLWPSAAHARPTTDTCRASGSRIAMPAGISLVATSAIVLTGCSAGADRAPTESTITVLAAASLTESFTRIAADFERSHPGVRVTVTFAASSSLATQVAEGAPADVFAAASSATMATAVRSGATVNPSTFATNSMTIAVPPANPGRVTGLPTLADPAVKVAVCSPRVPCGDAASAVFRKAGITVTPVTREPDVKAVATKVRLGEVDAGIVYVTDIRAAGTSIDSIPIPSTENVSTDYPIAVLRRSSNPTTAQEFTDFVLGPAGQRVLAEAGFGPPE